MSFGGGGNDSFGFDTDNNPNKFNNSKNNPNINESFGESNINSHQITATTLITEKINTSILHLTTLYKRKLRQHLPRIFFYLKYFPKTSSINSLYLSNILHQTKSPIKEHLVLSRIRNALQVIYSCYEKSTSHFKSKYFIKWKVKVIYMKHMKQVMMNIKEKYNKRLNGRKEEIENHCKMQESVMNGLKGQVNSVNDVIIKMKNVVKVNEEKEQILMKTIKSLEESNSHLEQEIKKIGEVGNANIKGEGNSNIGKNKRQKLEKRIKELNQQKRKLNEEMEELDAYFSVQVKEMNEMLDDFEEKAKQLNHLQRLK